MSTLEDRIQALGDADARRVLTLFARNQPGYRTSTLTPEWQGALQADPALTATRSNEGDLARAALLLLADDPDRRPVLDTLVSGPRSEQYGLVETAAVVSAVLFVLGTHVRIERDKDGRWAFKIEKKPTDTKLLKDLMAKLMGLIERVHD